jgi:hypothetical protein
MFDLIITLGIIIGIVLILWITCKDRIKSIWISNKPSEGSKETIEQYNARVINETEEFIERVHREGREAINNDPLAKDIDQSIVNIVALMESSHPDKHIRGYNKDTFDHESNGYWIGDRVLRHEDFH